MSEWDTYERVPLTGAASGEWDIAEQVPLPAGKNPLDWYREIDAERRVAELSGKEPLQTPTDLARSISTITGMPVPTLEEKWTGSKAALAKAAPIVGDIAATALAPELGAAKWGTGLGIRALNLLMRSGAAGLGGFGGDIARQKLEGDADLDFGRAALQGAAGAVGEAGPSALIGAGKALARPAINLAADFPTVAKPIARQATKVLRKQQAEVKDLATQRAVSFAESLGGVEPEKAGMAVGEGLDGKADYARIYAPWNEAVERIAKAGKGEVLLDDTTQYISEMMDKFRATAKTENQAIKEMVNWMGFAGDARTVNTIKQIMRDGYVGPGDAKYVMANFWKKSYGSTTDAANKWKEGLKVKFLGDVERQEPGAAAAKQLSDKTFQAVHQFLRESPGANKIISRMDFGRSDRLYFQDYPEKVGEIIFKKQPDEILQLRNAVSMEKGGDEAWKMLSMNHVADLVRSSMQRAKDTGRMIVRPAELAEKIYAAEDKIKAAMPLGEWKRLKDEADHFASIAEKFETIQVNEGFDLFEAWAVLSPKSQAIAKKALDVTLGTVKQGAKIGLHLGAGEYDSGAMGEYGNPNP